MGAILALIIVVGFGVSLLVYFHYDDKKRANIGMGE
jgi:hypothetical protein